MIWYGTITKGVNRYGRSRSQSQVPARSRPGRSTSHTNPTPQSPLKIITWATVYGRIISKEQHRGNILKLKFHHDFHRSNCRHHHRYLSRFCKCLPSFNNVCFNREISFGSIRDDVVFLRSTKRRWEAGRLSLQGLRLCFYKRAGGLGQGTGEGHLSSMRRSQVQV